MFKPQEKKVFIYHNGTKKVAGDPLAIQRHFHTALDSDIQVDWKIIRSAMEKVEAAKNAGAKEEPKTPADIKMEQEAVAAFDRILFAGRKAFGITDLTLNDDDTVTGLNDEEVMALLKRFGEYMGTLKKKPKKSQT